MIKKCTKCLKNKDISEFYSISLYWCKDCRSEYYRIKNNATQIRKDLDTGNRACNRCKEERVLEDFPKDKKCKLGRARTCKICVYLSRKKPEQKANQKRLRENGI